MSKLQTQIEEKHGLWANSWEIVFDCPGCLSGAWAILRTLGFDVAWCDSVLRGPMRDAERVMEALRARGFFLVADGIQ